ncbi:MAG TPA: STAS domain-containing protein [Actinomycetota bacterium]|jgi:ABC-type transporter Mla MlaB component
MWHFQPPLGRPTLEFEVTGGGTADVAFRLEGTLAHDWASRRLERALEGELRDRRVLRIHLDMNGVEAIDLEGVAVLVRLFREAQHRNTTLTVDIASGPVRRRLVTTGVMRFLAPPTATAS